MEISVSVIIVNYNTRLLLEQCLRSIYAKTSGIGFEVIVVDNGSSDGSQAAIESKFKDLIWINSGGNIGFGRANNLGVSRAKGKYLFLLNSDTLLLNNAIKLFYDYMQGHSAESIGVVGCWLLDGRGGQNISSVYFPSPRSELAEFLRSVFSRKKKHQGLELDVDGVNGADMFIEASVFDRFSGFDPNIFMYYEETDLQFRMNAQGYISRLIDGPSIVHLDGGSFDVKGLSYRRFVISQTSYNYYMHKHYGRRKRMLLRAVLALVRLTIFIRLKGTLKQKIKAYGLILSGRYTLNI